MEGTESCRKRVKAEGVAAFSLTELQLEVIVPLVSPALPRASREGAISETPINLAHTAASWGFPEVPPHPTFGLTQAVSSSFSTLMACLGSSFRFS